MRVLFVVHGFPPLATGGTEIYAHDLALSLGRQGHDVMVLARRGDPASPEYSVSRDIVDGLPVVRPNYTFLRSTSFEETYRNRVIDGIAGAVIDEFRPDVVHVHHLTCLSTGIVPLCESRGIPTLVTLHDFWLLCHRGQLLDLALNRCAGPQADRCAACAGVAATARPGLQRLARGLRALERRLPPGAAAAHRRLSSMAARRLVPGGTSGVTARRLAQARAVWNAATLLHAPSQTVWDRFVEFGAPRTKLRRHELGIDLRPFANLTRVPTDRLRIGFMGSLMVSKAPHLLLEATAGLRPDRVAVTLAGGMTAYHGDNSYADRIRPLLGQPGVRWLDSIRHEEIPAFLSSLDVLAVPSIWLENSPLVVREAFAAGVVVVASNLGGLAEAVSHERDGLLVEPGDAGSLRQALVRLLDEPGLLDRLRSGIPPVHSIDDDAASTSGVYEELRHSDVRHGVPPLSVAGVVLNYRTPDDTLLAVRSLEASRRRVSTVVVDNDGDGTCERRLAHGRADARVVKTPANLGYSGGCNVGIREALEHGADLVLLLNSDAVVAPDTIGRLEEALAATPRAGIVAPLIVSRAEPGMVSSAGIRFSDVTGRMRHEGFGRDSSELLNAPPRMVAAVSGCAMLVRRKVFDTVGLLDDRYFFSFEDIDFCRRAAGAGWESWLVPSAVVHHEGGQSIGPTSARRLYYAARNHLLLARTVAPAARPLSWLRAAGIVALNLAYAVRAPGSNPAAALSAVLRGVVDHLRGRYGAGTAA